MALEVGEKYMILLERTAFFKDETTGKWKASPKVERTIEIREKQPPREITHTEADKVDVDKL